jgi:hypothetical protein
VGAFLTSHHAACFFLFDLMLRDWPSPRATFRRRSPAGRNKTFLSKNSHDISMSLSVGQCRIAMTIE